MKLSTAQLKELKDKGSIDLDLGILKRTERKITKYFDVGAKGFKKKNLSFTQYHLRLKKEFVNYLRVMNE